jgi:hypothetical protein
MKKREAVLEDKSRQALIKAEARQVEREDKMKHDFGVKMTDMINQLN